jgi:hypothetical protein
MVMQEEVGLDIQEIMQVEEEVVVQEVLVQVQLT